MALYGRHLCPSLVIDCSFHLPIEGRVKQVILVVHPIFRLLSKYGNKPNDRRSCGASAQESRLAVFRALVQAGPEGMPAGQIATLLGIAPSSLSFHLKELSHAQLVTSRQKGRFVYYCANFETMNGLGYLTENCCGGTLFAGISVFSLPGEAVMKRIHIHLAVTDLKASIGFYSGVVCGRTDGRQERLRKVDAWRPARQFRDLATWRHAGPGPSGVQVENEAELAEMHVRLEGAALPVDTQMGTACCYAKSNKYWTVDPQGIAWESYRTLNDIPVFGDARNAQNSAPTSEVAASALPLGQIGRCSGQAFVMLLSLACNSMRSVRRPTY